MPGARRESGQHRAGRLERRLDRARLARAAARSPRAPAALGSATCIIPSTNSRSPSSVGIRPALVCGAASRPSSSSSLSTERIEAGDRLTPALGQRLRAHRLPAVEIALDHQAEDLARARSVSSLTGGRGHDRRRYLVASGGRSQKLTPNHSGDSHATIRPRARRDARHRDRDRLHQARRGLVPGQLRRHQGAGHRQRRGEASRRSCAARARAGSPPNTRCCRAPPTPAAAARRPRASRAGARRKSSG